MHSYKNPLQNVLSPLLLNAENDPPEKKLQNIHLHKHIPDLMMAADYIISRAGANSIFEFLVLNKPTLLIPLSKKASRGDQILNANSFAKEGYSLVIEEEDITNESFLNKVSELVEKKQELIKNMKKGKSKMGNDAVLEVIMSEIKNK